MQQENNDIFNSAVDEIILQENNKVRAGTEAQEIIDTQSLPSSRVNGSLVRAGTEAQEIIESEYDENDLFQIDNMSLKNKK